MNRLIIALLVSATFLASCGLHAAGDDEGVYDIGLYDNQVVTVLDVIYALPPYQVINARFGTTTAGAFFRDLASNQFVPPLEDVTKVIVTKDDDYTYVIRPYETYKYVTDKFFWFTLPKY